MEVLELRDQDTEAWDEYVYDSPQASVFHLVGWKDVMQDTFGLRPRYLFAQEGDRIRGVLPLLQIKSILSGHFFTSMPSALCAQDEESASALVERAMQLVKASGAGYLILRDSYQKWDLPELVTTEDHCTLLVELGEDPDRIWMGINRRVRQSTRKAFRASLEVVSGPEYLPSFYPVYSRAMRDKGTPTLGFTFFSNVLNRFPAHFTVMIVRHNGQVLGGGLVAFFRDTIYNTWGGMLHRSYALGSNYILYWETLRYGCEQRFQWADLGRSAWNSGTFQFKRKWRAVPRPLYQQYYLNGVSQPPPVGNSREAHAGYRLFVEVWRHLPLSATDVLGPQLRKRVPFG